MSPILALPCNGQLECNMSSSETCPTAQSLVSLQNLTLPVPAVAMISQALFLHVYMVVLCQYSVQPTDMSCMHLLSQQVRQ